jgi:SAM-dependent methyltransferase
VIRSVVGWGRRLAGRYLRAGWRATRVGWRDDGGFRVRDYKDYNQYVRHQETKLASMLRGKSQWLEQYEREYPEILRARLEAGGHMRAGLRTLCLGARLGGEVRAFLALGCFAVGLDLNPGPKNRYVLHGDFHHLVWPDESVDVVFTNALDHALDIGGVLKEVRRVLAPQGLFLVEASVGTEAQAAGDFESLAWARLEDLVATIEAAGFKQVGRASFSQPWLGEHLAFRRTDEVRSQGA